MGKTDLSTFDNSWYNPGSKIKILTWYFINLIFFRSAFLPISSLKRFLLKIYGAKIGKNVVIKPSVNIKYPWKLEIGDYTWIGENVWIDNLDHITIGAHCCLSQGALLICGNHDYKKPSFDLTIEPIIVEDGAWIGAKSVVTGGVKIGSHAVLSLGSVTSSDLKAYYIYSGNPALEIRKREIA